MRRRKVVIPTKQSNGFNSEPCEHFGKCSVFTIVTLEDGVITAVETVPNEFCGCCSCYDVIRLLREKGMTALLVHKIGMYPLRILDELNVSVHFFSRKKNIRDVLEDFLRDKLRDFSHSDICDGECER